MSLYRKLSGLNEEEREALLISLGMTQDQALDWLLNYNQNKAKVQPKTQTGQFTQSPQWVEIQERVRKLTNGKSMVAPSGTAAENNEPEMSGMQQVFQDRTPQADVLPGMQGQSLGDTQEGLESASINQNNPLQPQRTPSFPMQEMPETLSKHEPPEQPDMHAL